MGRYALYYLLYNSHSRSIPNLWPPGSRNLVPPVSLSRPLHSQGTHNVFGTLQVCSPKIPTVILILQSRQLVMFMLESMLIVLVFILCSKVC